MTDFQIGWEHINMANSYLSWGSEVLREVGQLAAEEGESIVVAEFLADGGRALILLDFGVSASIFVCFAVDNGIIADPLWAFSSLREALSFAFAKFSAIEDWNDLCCVAPIRQDIYWQEFFLAGIGGQI